MTRKYNTDILVDLNDKWFFHGSEITNNGILNHFKTGLSEDERGIFITNKFGELSEHGYIKTMGYPLHINHIKNTGDGLVFYSENGENFPAQNLVFYRTGDDSFFVMKKDASFIKYRFGRNCTNEIMDFLLNENDSIFVMSGKNKYPVLLWTKETSVDLPD